MNKILFFDLETTGVKHWQNGIHQIAGMIEINGKVVESFDFKVRPDPRAVIEAEALEVGGVTEAQIKAYPPMQDVHKQLCKVLGKHVDKYNRKDKFHLCGYNNMGFDNNFLRAFFIQNNDNYFGSWFWSNSLDVMVLATHKLMAERDLMPNFKLNSVAKHLGIKVDDSKLHDGLYDVGLTREIYYKLENYESLF